MTIIVKNNDTEKDMYSGYEITFDGRCEWSFGNDADKNVVIFGLIIVHHLILTILKMNF